MDIVNMEVIANNIMKTLFVKMKHVMLESVTYDIQGYVFSIGTMDDANFFHVHTGISSKQRLRIYLE